MRFMQNERINRKNWKDHLASNLKDFEVIYPNMPNMRNSRYEEWKLWFEKALLLLTDEVILVGHSLGGTFLVKYLSENDFSKKITALHLVAPPYDTEVNKESLADFALSSTVENISEKADKIFIYQSKDDPEVAFADAEKYKRDLPMAELIAFEDRGHFLQEDFPELIDKIKEIN